jgi:hypothetical protein
MTQIEYMMLGEPRMVENDNRRITFTGYEKATMKEIVCMTHGDNDAPLMLQKLKSKTKELLLTGDYIDGGHGILFRVDNIQFKVPQMAHN